MPILICPECGAENPLMAERCQDCDASLLDVAPSPSIASQLVEQEDLDLFPQEEHDLPDLLNALKQDADIEADDQAVDDFTNPSEESPVSDNALAGRNPPDWLTRIRQRADQEKDSVGEVTQDITHAQHKAEDKGGEDLNYGFESWIQRLRDQARDDAAGENLQTGNLSESSSDEEGGAAWLSKVRKAHGIIPEADGGEDSRLGDREGDSLLQWLVELENGGEKSIPLHDEESVGDSGRVWRMGRLHPIAGKTDLDDTQEVFTEELRYEAPELSVSHEEQAQADQLTAVIVDERATRPARKANQRSFTWVLRLVVSGLVIAGVVFSLFFSSNANLPEGLLQPQNDALLTWVEALPEDASILVVFDYSAGYSSEIKLAVMSVLSEMVQKDTAFTTISSSISGTLLAEQMFSQFESEEGLDVKDLGYFPLAVYGAYSLAIQAGSDPDIASPAGMDFEFPMDGYEGILILSDSYEGARVWIEQLSALMPDAVLNLLVTAQAGPMLLPYWESGQVTGMVSGVSEAAGVDAALLDGTSVARYWRAYQTGILMLIALMVIGVIFAIDRTANDERRGAA